MKRFLEKKWIALLLCMSVLLGAALPARTVKADPDVPQILQNYVDSLHFLAGEDHELLTNYVSKEVVYNLDDVPEKSYLGYYQADLDKDGQEELLLVSVDDALQRNICLQLVEVVDTKAKVAATINLGKECSSAYSLNFPIAVVGTQSSYMDFFVYELDGEPRIMVELHQFGDVPEELHHQLYANFAYDGKKFVKHAANGMWWESDHSPDFALALPELGVDTQKSFYDWRDGKLMMGNFLIYNGYVNVCRVEAIPAMEKEEAEAFFKVNHGYLDGKKGATLRFTMPRIREVLPMSEKQRLDINMLLSGMTATNKEYWGATEDWDTEKRLDYLYTLLNKNQPEKYVFQMGEENIFPKRTFLYQYDYEYEDTDLGPCYSFMVLNALAEGIFGEAFDFDVRNRKLSPGLQTNEQFLYVTPSGGYSTLLLADTMYRENEHLFVVGSAYETASTTVYLGRFTAELYDFPYSMFGYSLVSFNGITPPQTVPKVTATASSAVPDDGEEYKYGPEMAVDGKRETAWNEGAQGTGVGEWISVNMPMALDTPVASIRVANGYQKDQKTFDNNGMVVRAKLEFSDGTELETYLNYEDAVIFEKPVATSFVKLTILEATSGEAYEDTCISEIDVFTYDSVLWSLPVPYSMIDETGMIGLNAGKEKKAAKELEWWSKGVVHVYNDYILVDSSVRLYTANELKGLSKEDLRIARNEIYARHGRRFASADLQKYFDEKPWYKGTIDASKFDDSVLSKIELDNIKLIESVEAGSVTP